MLKRKTFPNREAWVAGRGAGLGASDAAVACGISKWKTNTQLWKEKTGLVIPADISDNEAVSFGIKAEPHLRALFALMHPELEVEYHAYDILYQDDKPFIAATLDGELIDVNGNRGVLEIKTARVNSKQGWSEWQDRVPDGYYAQCCHQLLATGYSFVYLYALIMGLNSTVLREYRFERDECQEDMDWLLEQETKFWRHVKEKKEPPQILPGL